MLPTGWRPKYVVELSEEWREKAACRDTDPDLFFPTGTTGPALEQVDKAKKVCGSCAVRSACLEYALVTNQDAGIWGGYTEEERRSLRHQWVKRGKPLVNDFCD